MKKTILFVALFLSTALLYAQKPLQGPLTCADSSTHLFAVRGTDSLYLNFYCPVNPRADRATVVYLYGGAFIKGNRNDKQTRLDADALLRAGFSVAAIEYRKYFGMVEFSKLSKSKYLDALDSAFNYAAADCGAAVAFLVRHADSLNIDTTKIILTGSSAGAIAVLQLDFARANGLEAARNLPQAFRPAAVVSYSGAVFNHHGSLKYKSEPAPTAFFYGDVDKVVPYRCISLFSAHYGGSDCLISNFADNDYVYWAFRYRKHGHEVCSYLYRTMTEYTAFIDAVLAGRRIHYDSHCSSDEFPITPLSKLTLKDLLDYDEREEGVFDEERYR